jgi:hypothetical protein
VFCSTDQERGRSVILVASENARLLLCIVCPKASGDPNRGHKKGPEQASKDLATKRVENAGDLWDKTRAGDHVEVDGRLAYEDLRQYDQAIADFMFSSPDG